MVLASLSKGFLLVLTNYTNLCFGVSAKFASNMRKSQPNLTRLKW